MRSSKISETSLYSPAQRLLHYAEHSIPIVRHEPILEIEAFFESTNQFIRSKASRENMFVSDFRSLRHLTFTEETPKEIVECENRCFLCGIILTASVGKHKVFGKSAVRISNLIESAIKVDLKLDVTRVLEIYFNNGKC